MLANLTAEQKNIVNQLLENIELAADIAHSQITLYLPDADKKFLQIYKQALPLTQVFEVAADLSGRRVRGVEEPLVMRSLQKNIVVEGMREYRLGLFNSFKVYPVSDTRGKCFAAATFVTSDPDDIAISAAVTLLRGTKNAASRKFYGRMTAADGMMIVAPDRRIVAANSNARHIFQVMGVKNIIGRRTSEMAVNWPLVGMALDTGLAESKTFSMRGLFLSMRVLPVTGKPKGGCAVVILRDITELKKKDEELLVKSVVIKEIHHRVKNNLQTIASLLRLQERRAQSSEAKTVLRDCIGRVNSIAVVHEYLSQQDNGLIDVAKVVRGICQEIMSSMLRPDLKLQVDFEVDAVLLASEKATSVALILNELLQNALEHAFADRSMGRLRIVFHDLGGCYRLEIADDGAGMPERLPEEGTLGLKIIKTMAEADLKGSFHLTAAADGGTKAIITIPKEGAENV